ncbi:Zn-dependent alcohol dehydrogenase [Citricoccus muralis]|uniref:Zn-dependent alcohol dehydrogenase n=1 Tax=Citricoccus muralis TaxID=169134 RepID=A0ABY8H949_9MICC|nr:Zn-dependent alcohol dehydrogenase [Citricoccus muralis]WFP17230.1 Zn-dependent alcohol dehydrogenase [Citricoccus muralis]
MKAKAMVMHEIGKPMVLEELEVDQPGPGEVLMRIEATGVCHSDLHYLAGDFIAKTPIVLGHEGAGVVEAVGEGVAAFKPGDKAVLMWRPRCGSCEYCLAGRPALCSLGRIHAQKNELLRGGTRLSKDGVRYHHLMGDSCFSERAVVSQESLVAIDQDVPSEIAAIVGCAVITGMGTVMNCMPEPAGKSIAIIGAGGVGLAAVIAAQLVGAAQIIVSDVVDSRLEKARELGATHTLNSAREDFADRVQEITGGGANYVFEAIGKQPTIRAGFDALRSGGTLVVAGLGSIKDEITLPLNQLVQGEKRVVGALYGSSNIPLQLPEILGLYRSGRIPLDKLLDQTFPLAEANEAVEHLRTKAVGRPVLLP